MSDLLQDSVVKSLAALIKAADRNTPEGADVQVGSKGNVKKKCTVFVKRAGRISSSYL